MIGELKRMIGMHNLLQTIILATIQGLTEFLPVSSSAHLVLVPQLFNWQDKGLAFDVATHMGTLGAVIFYFKHDIAQLTINWFKQISGAPNNPASHLAWKIIIATIPVGLCGLIFHNFIATYLRTTQVIAISTIVFAIVLLFSQLISSNNKYQISYKHAFYIGLAQALALIPGVSRSGITLSAGLACNIERAVVAKFSFLASVPVIILASILEFKTLWLQPQHVDWLDIFLAFSWAFVIGYMCIGIFIRILKQVGVIPFVIYRLALGAFLIFFHLKP